MILYHFTRMENVEAIQRESLRARSQATLDGSTILGTFYKPAVYLTDQPTENTDAENACFQQQAPHPIVGKRWLLFDTDEPLAGFTIRLPSHDRNLKQYEQWLRANYHRVDGLPDPSSDNLFGKRAMTEWWLYFGNIRPSKIVEFTVEEAIPYRPVRL